MTYDQYLHQETEKHYKAIGLDTDEPIPECGYCGAEDYTEFGPCEECGMANQMYTHE